MPDDITIAEYEAEVAAKVAARGQTAVAPTQDYSKRDFLTYAELRELTSPQMAALREKHPALLEKSMRMIPETAQPQDRRYRNQ